MAKRKRPTGTRERFDFWLDLTKDEHFSLADLIHELKQQRAFARTIRDGIRLIHELRAGETELLFELFPWIAQQQRAAGDGSDGDLRREIAELKLLMHQQNDGGYTMQGGPKAMTVPTISAPVFDDDMPALVMKKAKSDGRSAQNFLDSAFALIN